MKFGLPADSVLRQWGFEIFCIITALGVLAAMNIVLFVFDSKSVFDGRVITLNAIISTLSTASRVSLLAMLASAISQWNWLLFSNGSRRLIDFEYLSAASRGPLGSVKVLLNSHIVGGWVVRVGALLTILTIALDPFAQQLVQLGEELKSVEPDHSLRAEIKTAPGYSRIGEEFYTTFENITVDGDKIHVSGPGGTHAPSNYAMQIPVFTSFVESNSGITQQPSFNCSSGKCTFDKYESLSVCSRCDDVSSSLKRRTKKAKLLAKEFGAGQPATADNFDADELFDTTEYYLPNGLYLNNADHSGEEGIWIGGKVHMTMFGTGDRNQSLNMQGIDTLIWAQSFIMVDHEYEDVDRIRWPGPEVSAYECELHYCVKEFTATIDEGTLRETYKETDKYKRDPDSWKLDYSFQQSQKRFTDLPDWTKDYLAYDPVLSAFQRTQLLIGLPSTQYGFRLDSGSIWGNSLMMKTLFTACVDTKDNCTEENKDELFRPPNGFYAGDSGRHKPDFAEAFWKSPDLNSTFERISVAMTTAIRNGGDEAWISETDDPKDPNGYFGVAAAKGKVIQRVPIYKVVWPWVALHCVSTLGGLVFLALTIRYTSKAGLPAWKTSELAIFAQAVGMERIFDGDEKRDALENKAKEASVVLLGGKSSVDREDSEKAVDERSILTSEARPVESQESVERARGI